MSIEAFGKKRELTCFFFSHPIVQFCYFFMMIFTSMFVTHPIMLGISMAGVLAVLGYLYGVRHVLWHYVCRMLPILCVVIVINAVFNHYGVTVITYVKTGAVTLEAIVYGVILAMVFGTMFLWFVVFNQTITTDKIIYLFGRKMPKISLALSMILGFIPRFLRQYKKIKDVQRVIELSGNGICMENRTGKGKRNGKTGYLYRVRKTGKMLSILVTWALESSMETADSMKSRGYGTVKRTSYSIFRFTRRDVAWLMVLLIMYSIVVCGILRGDAQAIYNPFIRIDGIPPKLFNGIMYIAWGMCCFFPLYQELFRKRWNCFGKYEKKEQ